MNSELATNHSLLATGSDEVLVRVEGVSKKFCRSLKRSLWYGLCDIAGELSPYKRCDIAGGRSSATADGAQSSISRIQYSFEVSAGDKDLRDGEFWAVNDVSFELRRGECLGLIGHNGAGKTTLLKILNGLIKPDRGRIEMNGRVGALIALGAGFNPILTGRENIYINGSVLGLSKKEIDEKVEEIIDFAEIDSFIDMPVQNYSSGMQVRLGFAVATALKPDVLILDEVLAVGDANFRHKCYHRISKLMNSCAVIFVSHSMDSIAAVSTLAGFMETGALKYLGKTNEAIAKYLKTNAQQADRDVDGGAVRALYHPIIDLNLSITPAEIQYNTLMSIRIHIEALEQLDNVEVSFTATDQQERPVMNWNLSRLATKASIPRKKGAPRAFSIYYARRSLPCDK